MKRLPRIVLTVLAVVLSIQTNAQPSYFGIYNSLKGIGAVCELPAGEDGFVCLTAFVEMYGIPTGRCDSPGAKLNFSRNYIYRTFVTEDTVFSLYAGPGLSTGYMRDYELGQRVDNSLTLTRNPGVMVALSGRAGCRFSFEKRLSLDLSFTAEAGLFARRVENANNLSVKLYRNGIMQSIYPELSILVSL